MRWILLLSISVCPFYLHNSSLIAPDQHKMQGSPAEQAELGKQSYTYIIYFKPRTPNCDCAPWKPTCKIQYTLFS